MDHHPTYAMRDGTHLVEVRLHPDFVDWAGQDYAVIAHTDDPNPAHPAWTVIDRADLQGPWHTASRAPSTIPNADSTHRDPRSRRGRHPEEVDG